MPDDKKITRKLKAILSADVKGYSLLMADDEIHTIQTLKSYRQIMSDLIHQHSGRVVDNPGDNLLAEFSSAVDAVECSVQIQNRLKKENAKFIEDMQLQFRIGVNVGDVVQDGDRIYGEGVNIAARIESLADAGGVCISRNTYDHIKNKLQVETEYLGEHDVKNIKEPVRVYKVLMDSDTHVPLVEKQLELPDKPSIAVLPFDNMSGDPSQEYFSDGLTEQIISGLSKVNNLFVIARNSSFAYKGKEANVKQIAQELGVKYILEGSVQRSDDKIRITAQLIDTATDYHMWSNTYDNDISDIFKLQDAITLKLCEEMEINLTSGEQAILWAGQTSDLQAYHIGQKGMHYFNRNNRQDNVQARHLFLQAFELDETFAGAVALIGWTHQFDMLSAWSDNLEESFLKAEKYAHKAIELDEFLDTPHTLLAWNYMYKREYDKSIEESERAVVLNSNGANAIINYGLLIGYAGEPEKGIIFLKKGIRLDPVPAVFSLYSLADGYYQLGQYEKAIDLLNSCLRIEPEAFLPNILLTACYIHLNGIDKAQDQAKKVLEIDPKFSLEAYAMNLPQKDREMINKLVEALHLAGLPE
jgi:adenylate cyclase